jgi:hypothetical protein
MMFCPAFPQPTFRIYCPPSSWSTTPIREPFELIGPNGSAAFFGISGSDIPLVEFPRLPLTNIRRLHLGIHWWKPIQLPTAFYHLSFFPALEVLIIERDADLSQLLSALFSNPSSSPSLKALTFLDCIITEEFMEELTRFSSDRKSTTSARLHSIVILDCEGKFPSIASIRKLREHVPVVDVRVAEELPTDLT